MKISHNTVVRTLQVVTHLAAVYGIVVGVQEELWNWFIVAWLTYWFTGIMGINVGFHRWLSHKAFKTYRPIEWLMMFCGVLTTTGSPIAWAVAHRLHHKHTDKPHDPHNPHDIGVLRAWFGFWNRSGFVEGRRVLGNMTKDPMLLFFHKYYTEVLLAWIILLGVIWGWEGIVFIYCIPAVLSLHSANGIIVIPHYHGYKLYETDDSSKNSWIANIVTMGEGWHNTHHKYPGRWNTQIHWWEWDLPAQIIKLIRRPDSPEK